jgi:hypothetical protein
LAKLANEAQRVPKSPAQEAVNSRIIGYHGCDWKVAMEVVARKTKLKPGTERYDWLGTGVYFWEDDPNLALGWAKHTSKKRPELIQNPAVIGAVIDLKNCLNLVQTGASQILCAAHQALAQEVKRTGAPMPVNENEERRFLDHAVFETLHELRQ